jgi:RNA polymerase sigma factor (sigma-70 family)
MIPSAGPSTLMRSPPDRRLTARNLHPSSGRAWQNAPLEPVARLHEDTLEPMRLESKEQRAGEFAMQRQRRLMALAVRMCRNRTDAEDLVQEVILRFIQHFGKAEHLPSEPKGEAWLVTAVANLFKDQCRRQRVRENGVKDPTLTAPVLAAQDAQPPSVQVVTLTDEQFSKAKDTLSPKARETLDLHLAEMSYEDISQSLGIPQGTVRKRLHDARVKMREYFQSFRSPKGP